ncbi:MAG: hypothetical protein KDD61_03235 [Bdellovibrionales bacterium]|nr:hypothetical protein [Bdellovibrionales bacterium]
METTTARIDMQKLQILSDRIAYTLEALNQVRLSAYNYGIQNQFGHQNQFGYANSWGVRPELRMDYPMNVYGASYNMVPQHSQLPSYTVAPFGYTQNPLFTGQVPVMNQGYVAQPQFSATAPFVGQTPFANTYGQAHHAAY